MSSTKQTGGRFFRLLSAYAIIMYTVQTSAIALSLMQMRISTHLALAVIAIAVAAGMAYMWHSRPTGVRVAPPWRALSLAFLAVIVAAAAVWLLLFVAAYYAPDISWDGNAYHIPTLAQWDVRGYIHWAATPYSNMINGYPKGAELLGYIAVKAVGDSNILNTYNLLFLPLGVMGIASIARSFGAARLAALCAGVAYLAIPVNVTQAPTTYVDSAYASCAIAFLAILVAAAKTDTPQKLIAPLGAAMSLPPAIKSSGIALVAIGGLALAIVWGAPLLKERAKGTRPALAMWMLCLLAALGVSSVSSYWYLRNYVHTGTPLYPVGVSLHGQVIFPGAPLAMAIQEEEGTPPQMRPWPPLQRIGYTWLQGLRAWPSSIETPESRLGGLGFIWAAGCLPAIGLLALSPKLRPNPQRSFWLLLVVTGAAFITMPMNWWARYTVWIYALGLPCLAVAIEKVLQARRAALFGVAWGGACALLLIFEGAHAGIYALDATFPGALVQSPRSALTPANWRWSYAYLFPELEGTAYDQLLAEASIVAIGPANWPADAWPIFGVMGQLSQPIGARHVVHLGTKSSAADLAAQSVQFVVWDKDVPLPQDIAAVVADSQTAGQFLILRLSPPG